jgi:hypothetical protein
MESLGTSQATQLELLAAKIVLVGKSRGGGLTWMEREIDKTANKFYEEPSLSCTQH